MDPPFAITEGQGPLVAVALHAGHQVRPEVAAALELTPSERLREEDPFTDQWTSVAATRVVAHRSRFEVDLNRPRDQAVYRLPEQAWGLEVWRPGAVERVLAGSLETYDAFYRDVEALLRRVEEREGSFVVLDLHSYNHRRSGPDGPAEPPVESPDLNVGTGSMDRRRWASAVEAFLAASRASMALGRRLTVGENVRFLGGHFPAWVHATFPVSGCALAVEVKKFFMDEWTGVPDPRSLSGVQQLLAEASAAVVEGLGRC
jgi:N-formylglutamate deformylase